nr:hypothetical protein [uncultured Blautia sp.]
MRRKQLYAIMLAGTLATGGAPVTAMAADAATEAEESGETAEDLGSGEDTEPSQDETPADTTTDEPTEAPAEPTEAPQEPTEAPAEPTEAPAESTATSVAEPTGIAINKDGTTEYYKTLQEAVESVDPYSAENPNATVIEISEQAALSSTIDVTGKKIRICAVEDASIVREGDTFKEDMFQVSGENSELQLETADGKSLTVNGKLSSGETAATGSIVKVSDQAGFGLGAGVTLTENVSSAAGAAIECEGGNIVLTGGTITGNTGAKGAVYSDSNICVQGTVSVTDNTIGDMQANVYLDGEAQFAITSALTDSVISFTHANAADGIQVLAAAEGVDAETFKSAAAQFSYDTEGYTLNLNAETNTVTLTKAETPDPGPTEEFKVDKKTALKWDNHTTISFEMSATQDSNWYYSYVDSGTSDAAIRKKYDAKLATNTAKANQNFTVKATGVSEKNDKWLVVYVTSASGETKIKYYKIDQAAFVKKRPAAENSFSLTYKSGTLQWDNHTTASLKMTVTQDSKWYYFFVDADTATTTIQNMYDPSRATNEVKANKEFTVTAENVPEADSWLVVCAKPASGKAQMKVFKLNSTSFKNKRPGAQVDPTVTTRPPHTPSVDDSTVSGEVFEGAVKFLPGKFYDFTVTGAGMDNDDPVAGDVRWVPMYWSMAENPTSSQKNTTFRIGSTKGILNAKPYQIYIFFKKQIYNGSDWQDTDVIEHMSRKKTTFKAAQLTEADLTITPTGGADGGNGGDGSGNGSGEGSTDAELTATEAASEKDSGSTSKSAVSTLDESPIGTMVALAALSLLAGAYILIRKRKKDI